jgi:SulP family sulfate permease
MLSLDSPQSAVVIPKSMSYATIAGLPVQVGLYTAFLPMIIYAVLGSSRVFELRVHCRFD